MTLADLPSTSAAMATLTQTHPLLAARLSGVPATESTDGTASIATDGASVTVNPDFMAGRDERGRAYMLGFIALMIDGDFIGRIGDRDRTAWSMACNMSIHHQLAKDGLEGRPAESVAMGDDDTADLRAEEIYDRIMADKTMIFGRKLSELLAGIREDTSDDGDLPPPGEVIEAPSRGMGGYTHQQLDEAFDKVKDPDHWKNRIDAVVDADMRDVLDVAIPYFTGTAADFDDEDMEPGKLRVFADGYFAGPCN